MDLARRRRPTVTIGGVNYLAHAWLARHSDDAILGAILGDFVFGQSGLQDWPPAVRAEMYAGLSHLLADMGAPRLAADVGQRRLAALGDAGATPAEQAQAWRH